MAVEENLIVNPGFEEDFLAWRTWATGLAQVVIDTATAASGLKSAKLTKVEGDTGRCSINQYIGKDKLAPGVSLQVRLKSIADAWFRLVVYEWTPTGIRRQFRIDIPPSVDWMQSAWLEFTTPSGVEWDDFTGFQIVVEGKELSTNLDDFEAYIVLMPMVRVTFQSTPIAVTADINGVSVPSGGSIEAPLNTVINVTVPQEVAA